jgi:hypothetical protein
VSKKFREDLEINIDINGCKAFDADYPGRAYSSEGLDAPLASVDLVAPKDVKFLELFSSSELPVHQIEIVYEGWKLAVAGFEGLEISSNKIKTKKLVMDK